MRDLKIITDEKKTALDIRAENKNRNINFVAKSILEDRNLKVGISLNFELNIEELNDKYFSKIPVEIKEGVLSLVLKSVSQVAINKIS